MTPIILHPSPSPFPISPEEMLPGAIFVGLVLLATLYFVGAEQGATFPIRGDEVQSSSMTVDICSGPGICRQHGGLSLVGIPVERAHWGRGGRYRYVVVLRACGSVHGSMSPKRHTIFPGGFFPSSVSMQCFYR